MDLYDNGTRTVYLSIHTWLKTMVSGLMYPHDMQGMDKTLVRAYTMEFLDTISKVAEMVYSIFLKASHDELIHETITLHNHELITR